MRILKLAIALSLLLSCTTSWGAAPQRHVVVLVAGNLSIRDIADPNRSELTKLLQTGSIALVNTRTGRPNKYIEPAAKYGMEPECVSMGAGMMAIAGQEAGRAANTNGAVYNVPAGVLYETRTGLKPGKAEILHTEIAKLQIANSLASYHAVPGLLGSTLHSAGIKTAFIGSSDITDGIHREAATIAMDKDGRIDFGNADSAKVTVPNNKAPYGLSTNTGALFSEFDRVYPKSGFIVMDFGDTLRADAYYAFCEPEQGIIIKRHAVAELEKFISELMPRLDAKNDLFILISPNPAISSDMPEEKLTPIFARGPSFERGMLTSPSTRKPGVITVCDIAPTILTFFDIKPPVEMVGRPARPVATADAVTKLLDLNSRATGQAQRQIAMRGGSVVQSVMVALVTIGILLGVSGVWRRLAEWAALVPVALPLVMLYMPLIYSGGLAGAIVLLIFLTIAAIAACAAIFKSGMRAFAWLCGIAVLSIAIDLFRGAPLITSSIAGYSIIEGARYYGIGNELMGTMLGAGIMGVGAVLASSKLSDTLRASIAAIIFAVVLICIGAPFLGANAGGAAAAAPAVAIALLARRKGKLTAGDAVLVVIFAVLAIGAMFGIDAMRGSAAQSHVGRAAGTAASGGFMGLVMMAERKITLNFLLLATSPWSRLLGLAILGSGLLLWWLRRTSGRNPFNKEEAAAVLACCVGTVCAFIFNDSGVLAAATCAVFLWSFLSLKMLGLVNAKKEPGN